MLDVMFYEAFDEEAKQLKAKLPSFLSAGYTSKTIQEQGDIHPPANIICVRTQSQIPISWAGLLKGILSRSQGYDHLLAYRQNAGQEMALGYLDEYCSRAVAEHALMAMFFLLKKAGTQIRQFDTFSRDGLTAAECFQKNALVVGVGRIGSRIADMALGLNMVVRGVDHEPKKKNISYVPLAEGIPWADILFCALPLTGSTKEMLNYNVLSVTKKKPLLVNISRGEITPLRDMERLLAEGKLGALALDVYEEEPFLSKALRGDEALDDERIERIHRLKEKENVLFTPHNAFNTEEALERKTSLTVKSILSFKETGHFLFPVSD